MLASDYVLKILYKKGKVLTITPKWCIIIIRNEGFNMFIHKSNVIEFYLKDTFNIKDVKVEPIDDISAKVIFKKDGSNLIIKESDYNLIEIYIDNKIYQTLKMRYIGDTLKRQWEILNEIKRG